MVVLNAIISQWRENLKFGEQNRRKMQPKIKHKKGWWGCNYEFFQEKKIKKC